jgi:hypothetical protein
MLQYWGAGHNFFYFKGTPSCISRKTFSPLEHKLLVMGERIGEVLKMVYRLTSLQKHGISANRSGAIWCIALHGILLA